MSKKRTAAHNKKTKELTKVKLEATVRKIPERHVDENVVKTARSAREVEGKTQYRVTKVDDGARLDRWCKVHLKHIPYGTLQKLLRKGAIRVDDKKVPADTKLKPGQVVSAPSAERLEAQRRNPDDAFVGGEEWIAQNVRRHERKKGAVLSEATIREVQSWVLFKDKHIIVINKPYGLAVQGGSGVGKHLDMLLPALQYEMDGPPKLVHRLDRDTSGVLVLARTREVAADLQKGFANNRLKKVYVALCAGVPGSYKGEITSRMEKAERGKDSREVVVSGKEGKAAVTRYRVMEAMGKQMSLMQLEPVTGRTHQLRVHMAELGCPIVGDGKYGGKKAFVGENVGIEKKLHLHAWHITLPRPNGEILKVAAPLSGHMAESLKQLNLTLETKR